MATEMACFASLELLFDNVRRKGKNDILVVYIHININIYIYTYIYTYIGFVVYNINFIYISIYNRITKSGPQFQKYQQLKL